MGIDLLFLIELHHLLLLLHLVVGESALLIIAICGCTAFILAIEA